MEGGNSLFTCCWQIQFLLTWGSDTPTCSWNGKPGKPPPPRVSLCWGLCSGPGW